MDKKSYIVSKSWARTFILLVCLLDFIVLQILWSNKDEESLSEKKKNGAELPVII